MATNMSKKRKFVADGVFYAELNEVSRRIAASLPSSMHSHEHSSRQQKSLASSLCKSFDRMVEISRLCTPVPGFEISLPHSLLLALLLLLLLKLLTQELAEEGYAGVEVRVTPLRTEIIISATRPQNVLGEKGQRIRELTSVVQKRCVTPSLVQLLLVFAPF